MVDGKNSDLVLKKPRGKPVLAGKPDTITVRDLVIWIALCLP
jgi:hypothetical protein